MCFVGPKECFDKACLDKIERQFPQQKAFLEPYVQKDVNTGNNTCLFTPLFLNVVMASGSAVFRSKKCCCCKTKITESIIIGMAAQVYS